MKRKKQIMVGILSAALLFNGSVALTPAAYADDDEAVIIVKPRLDSKQVLTDWLDTLIITASAVADKDLSDIQDALASGQTLVQASGINGLKLSEGLFRLIDQTTANAASSYTATVDEINSLNAEIRSKTLEVLSVPGYAGNESSQFNFDAVLHDYLQSLTSASAALSEEDYIDILDRLKEGGTLVQAARLSEAQLVEHLMQPLNQQIMQAKASGVISTEDAAACLEKAEQAVRSGIQTPGGFVESHGTVRTNFDGKALLEKRAASIVEDVSLLTAEYDANELKDALEHGMNLHEAAGLSAEELISNLEMLWGNDIEEAYRNGLISGKVKEELMSQASLDIRAAVNAIY
ncbi:MAG: hypothetical protein K0S39_6147 [Paenibacillus sp.]|nr:hypothetical protein [Paenibacillus sp.]